MRFTRTALALTLGLTAGLFALGGCSSNPVGNAAVPEPAQSVVLEKYLGRWYELARYEARFQEGCEAVTADYSKNDDGTISVVNTCRQDSVNGELRTAEGKAYVVQHEGAENQNAKLRVSFFWPFYGDYWVLDHASDYSWSIVGEPSGKYLWILSRHNKVSAAVWDDLMQRVRNLGYNTNMLRITKH